MAPGVDTQTYIFLHESDFRKLCADSSFTNEEPDGKTSNSKGHTFIIMWGCPTPCNILCINGFTRFHSSTKVLTLNMYYNYSTTLTRPVDHPTINSSTPLLLRS